MAAAFVVRVVQRPTHGLVEPSEVSIMEERTTIVWGKLSDAFTLLARDHRPADADDSPVVTSQHRSVWIPSCDVVDQRHMDLLRYEQGAISAEGSGRSRSEMDNAVWGSRAVLQ